MPSRYTLSAAALIVFGIGVVGYLIISMVQQAPKDERNPFEGITRPKMYAETPTEGEASAHLVLYEFGDFFCAACKATQPVIEQIYASHGDVIVHAWKDFPFVSNNSRRAATAARCAGEQGTFWEYHDWLFDHQSDLGTISYEQGALDIGISTDAFSTCLASGKMEQYIERDFLEGQALGVDITPSFVIGDYAFAGPVTFETLDQIIRQQASK